MKPMISDERLREAVVSEIESDPEIAEKRHISVTALNGAVTLRGHVSSYHEKHEAVRAAERVSAVRAVADVIEVREPTSHERGDDEIAEEVANRRGRCAQSPDSVGVQVRDGRVLLHGHVESEAQRDAAESAARQLTGVRAVDNLIEVRSSSESATDEVERLVREAIARVSDVSVGYIQITLKDGTVQLRGHLPSLAALDAALKAAGQPPNVTAVESEIVVTIDEASRR